ncbi:MAG: hypothetical protein COT74_06955 [Bdellovibrionales bacterium CG10_big_fil_rev_8_21_14_0_10_45_34]|nr:MAG: hypothetical protein COT74_06955 [Bdellovibrionales bacterium CG10_big_fil_rev_8_21_14_0_10_45_34]
MLHVLNLSDYNQLELYLEQEDTLVLTAHPYARKQLLNRLTKSKGFFSSQNFQIYSSYFLSQFLIRRPTWNLVSRAQMGLLLEEYLKQNSFQLPKENRPLDILEFYLPTLAATGFADIVEEWEAGATETQIDQDEQRSVLANWQLARKLWLHVNEHQLICEGWAATYVLSLDELSLPKRIYVDLGLNISSLDVELISAISRQSDIYVIRTFSELDASAGYIESRYKILENLAGITKKAKQVSADTNRNDKGANCFVKRFQSQLAEVRDAVSCVESWLSVCGDSKKIAIVAPDLSVYKTVLLHLLKSSGIRSQRSASFRYCEHPQVQNLLSRLEMVYGKYNFEMLSLDRSCNGRYKEQSFREFRKSLKNLLGNQHECLEMPGLDNSYLADNYTQPQSGRAWLNDVAMRNSDLLRDEIVSRMLESFFEEMPDRYLSSFQHWTQALRLISQKEVVLKPDTFEGIHLVTYEEAISLELEYAYILGCSEEYLAQGAPLEISFDQISKIERDLGIRLGSADVFLRRTSLSVLLKRSLREVVVSHSNLALDGRELLPSLEWLLCAKEKGVDWESLNLPGATLWDNVQRQLSQGIQADEATAYSSAANSRIAHAPKLTPHKKWSASALKTLSDCGFRYMASRKVGLLGGELIDQDLGLLSKGTLIHALLRKCQSENWRLETLNEVFDSSYSEALKEENIRFIDTDSLRVNSAVMLKTLRRFLTAEAEYRKALAQRGLIIVAQLLEEAFEIEAGPVFGLLGSNELLKQDKVLLPVAITGKIDRIDILSDDTAAVFDYKSSTSSFKTTKEWVPKGNFQPALYWLGANQMIFERGLKAKVVVSGYIDLRSMSRDLGIGLAGNSITEILLTESRQVDVAGLHEFLHSNLCEIARLTELEKAGVFDAIPRETKICDYCDFVSICRAPHLHG